MNKKTLQEKIELAKLVPGMAHLPSFGLVLYPDAKGPVCSECGGTLAPIIDGKHLEGFCNPRSHPFA